ELMKGLVICVDKPEHRGTARTCPACEGIPPIRALFRKQVCETCGGSGKVHSGIRCEFCGRSVQFEYKGSLICWTEACMEAVESKLRDKKVSTYVNVNGYNDNELEEWRKSMGYMV